MLSRAAGDTRHLAVIAHHRRHVELRVAAGAADPAHRVAQRVQPEAGAGRDLDDLGRRQPGAGATETRSPDEFAAVQAKIDAADGWNLETNIEFAMDALRLPPPDADVTKLSGGERRRVALCRLLLSAPDLLLLDEPTNHLDIEGQEALEAELLAPEACCLLVSHDRHFVRAVGNRFWLIERKRLVELDGPEEFFASFGAAG